MPLVKVARKIRHFRYDGPIGTLEFRWQRIKRMFTYSEHLMVQLVLGLNIFQYDVPLACSQELPVADEQDDGLFVYGCVDLVAR